MGNLYEDLLAGGEAAIDQLIADRRQESVNLDFKAKPRRDRPDFDRDERKLLARASSGFANSAGGLLVLGVDARKDADDPVDCARAAQPISSIEECCSAAQSLIGEMVQPRYEGVSVAAIMSDREPSSGYLLIAVTRSERRPHRAEAGDGRYYKRAGDSFYLMEHYDIEDAFRRVNQLDLDPIWRMDWIGKMPCEGYIEQSFNLSFGLKNISEYLARFPYLSIECQPASADSAMTQETPWRYSRLDGWHHFDASTADVVHPNRETLVATMRIRIRENPSHDLFFNGKPLGGIPFSFKMRIGCEAIPMKTQLFSIDRWEVWERVNQLRGRR